MENVEALAVAIPPADFPLANGADGAHIVQCRVPFLQVLPQTELGGSASDPFSSLTAQPVHKSIIGQNISSFAHAENGDEHRAGLERGAEARLALPEPGLTGAQFGFG